MEVVWVFQKIGTFSYMSVRGPNSSSIVNLPSPNKTEVVFIKMVHRVIVGTHRGVTGTSVPNRCETGLRTILRDTKKDLGPLHASEPSLTVFRQRVDRGIKIVSCPERIPWGWGRVLYRRPKTHLDMLSNRHKISPVE